jgi:hypothetical protein
MNPPAPSSQLSHRERPARPINGWPILALMIALLAFAAYTLVSSRRFPDDPTGETVGCAVVAIFLGCGLFSLQPNEAAVLTLAGAYRGTVRANGFFWTSPLNKRLKISLRARNFNSDKVKVNDRRGNPIEIATVVVWRVQDTAQALFDVENYDAYVHVQTESVLRHVASGYLYDDGERNEITLRGGGEQVATALVAELQQCLGKAGIAVDEARLMHLAYAPEIAQAMLRRQQAEAVIAARQKIVVGAVSMVEMALRELADKGVVTFDEERKASMVSNLLVVLCGESQAHPVINTGTLYH